MKKQIDGRFLTVAVLALGLTVGCGGQATVDTEEQPEDEYGAAPSAADPLADRTMTVTGCLTAGDEAARPGASRSEQPSAAAGSQFVLEVTPEAAAPQDRPMGATAKYRLSAMSDVNLSEHVGHTVRVSGTMSQPTTGYPSSKPRPTDPNRTSPPEQEPASAMSNVPLLMVESIEHVSARCENRPTP